MAKTLLNRFLLVPALLLLVSCGGKSSPTSPSQPTQPTQTTWNLSGTVTSSQNGAGISGATARIGDGPNTGKSATTDGSGHYSFSGLQQSGFTVNFTAPNFNSTSAGVDLTSNKTLDVRMDPTPLFRLSGTGDSVFNIPSNVTRIQVTASYSGSCQNFIVDVNGRGLINVIIGTCSVADTRSPFVGTYALSGGGIVEIVSSTGVNWTFTEVR